MLILENTIVEDSLFEEFFCCDVAKCFGNCCIEGDAGAPLEDDEVSLLEDYYPVFKKYMTSEGVNSIDKNGLLDFDAAGCFVTPLINDGPCAFIYYENGIALCAIERAYNNQEIPFIKPISCHLYPIRLIKENGFIRLHYHRWFVCRDAREKGRKDTISLIEFLESPLVRKFGASWYRQLINHFRKRLKR